MQVSDTERTRRGLVKSAGDPCPGQEGHEGRAGGEHAYCRSRSVFWRGLVLSGLILLALITGCATLFGRTPTTPSSLKTPSTARDADPDTRLGQAVTPLVAAHPGRSGFYLLNNGIEALAARLLTAHRAERTLDVQYYLLHADLTGHVFVEQLLKAADRGVRVRLLLDDLTAKGYDVGLAALDFPPTHRGPHLQPLLTSHGPVVGLRD